MHGEGAQFLGMFTLTLSLRARLSRGRYGLGSCYLKMMRLPMAQYHFERAVEIHPANAVLLGCLGMVSVNVIVVTMHCHGDPFLTDQRSSRSMNGKAV
jgi:hypothetical protein